VSLDAHILADIFHIKAGGTLMLNTTNLQRGSIGPNLFRLSLTGEVDIVAVFQFNASFTIVVGGGTFVAPSDGTTFNLGMGDWVIDFSASTSFFGIATLSAYGWLASSGNFHIHLDGTLTLGTSDFGISGGFSIDIRLDNTAFTASGSGTVSARLFGVSFGSLGVSFSVTIPRTGQPEPVTLSVTVTIDLWVTSVSKTADFTIGYLSIPAPVFLAGSSSDPRTFSGGPLYLNVGSRASASGVSANADSSFTVDHVSGTAGNETVKVTALGRSQTFAGVSQIIANPGSGNNQIIFDNGVLSPVIVTGSNGSTNNDTFIYNGSSSATLDDSGSNGTVYLQTGPDTTSATLYGGSGNNTIIHSGTGPATIYGGQGSFDIVSNVTGDTIFGYGHISQPSSASGGETDINGASATVTTGGGTSLIKWSLANAVGTTTITATSGVGQNTLAVTNASANGSNILISRPTGYNLEVDGLKGAATTPYASLLADNVQELDLDASTGTDSITVDPLNGAGVSTVSLNLGQITVQGPNTTGNGGASVPSVSFSPDNAAKTVTIEGTSGFDHFLLSETNPDSNNRMQDVQVLDQGVATFVISNAVRSEGDTLIVNGEGGGDTLDASGLGNPNPTSNTTIYPDMIALQLISGGGSSDTASATLIGGPFNEVLQGGYGADTFIGGGGLDTFIDPTSNNTLIETHNRDMSLFGNDFISGRILGSNGGAYSTSGPPGTGTAGGVEGALAGLLSASPLPNFTPQNLGDHYATGAIVVNITGLFTTAFINGGSGNNTLVVNSKDGVVYVGGNPIPVTPWTGNVTLDNRGNTTDSNIEYYIVNTTGVTGAVVNINQSNLGNGYNELIVNGSDRADNITLNAAGTGAARVGTVTNGTDLVIYRGIDQLTVDTFGGNDNVLSNDTAVLTVINFGSGNDNAVVGTVPLIPDPGNRTLEFPNGVPVADTNNMTNGNSNPLFILGGLGNDTFEVDHNRAMLYLHGGAGDSLFLLNTFLVLREDPTNSQKITNLNTVFGGTGNNRYEYLQNAPVDIIGGPGTNTLVVVGTPIDDTFIITNTYVAGAGRIVSFTGIQNIEINGAGGNDTFWVLSTDPGVTVTIDGGPGDNTIHVGGTPPPLVFNPPSFTYQPPPFTVLLPPQVVYPAQASTLDFSGYTFSVSLAQFLAAGSNPTTLAQNVANNLVAILRAFIPFFQLDSINILNVMAQLKFDSFFGLLFNPTVQISIGTFQINYRQGQLVQNSKTVTPPKVVVQPAPQVVVAGSSYDLSAIKGRLVINGGQLEQVNGNTVVVHDQQGANTTGILQTRQIARENKVGTNAAGKPVFAPAKDSSGNQIFDTYYSLEGLGIGKGVDPNDEPFFGVEMFNVQNLDIRLPNSGVNFTVAATPAAVTALLNPIKMSIEGSTGNDTFNIKEARAAITILGGGGNDTLNASNAGLVSGINAPVTFYGNQALTEQQVAQKTADYAALLTNLPSVFVNSAPNLSFTDSSGHTIQYALPQLAPIVEPIPSDPAHLQVHAVVLKNGLPVEDVVQEKGLQETGVQEFGVQATNAGNLLWLDTSGQPTTDNTGVPDILAVPSTANGARRVYIDSNEHLTFTVTSIPAIIDEPASQGGQPVYLDSNQNKVFTNTGVASFVDDFVNGQLLYININGVKVTTNTGIPALIKIDRTQTLPFVKTTDTYGSATGTDTLNIDGSAESSNITGSLNTSQLPVNQLTGTVAGLTSFYPFDGNANDQQGANNPSATNAISFVPGKTGQGVTFGTGGYVDIPDSTSLDTPQVSVVGWAKPAGPGPNEDSSGSSILDKSINTNSGSQDSVVLHWRASDGRFLFAVTGAIVLSADTFPAGQFYHVAGTYDGATVKLYVNGVLEGQQAMASGIQYDHTMPWTVGANPPAFRANGFPRTWNGVIDDVAIFNRALSASEVQSLFTGSGAGTVQFHNGASSPDRKTYFGGEPVVDPFSGAPLVYSAAATTAAMTFNAAAGTIALASGSWTTTGFQVGFTIEVHGSAHNDGTYTIAGIDSTGKVLTISASNQLVNEGPVSNVLVLGGAPVLDLFGLKPLLDPSGEPVLHKAGDPVVHYAGDLAVQTSGANQLYLGGELLVNEVGTPGTPSTVLTGNPALTFAPNSGGDIIMRLAGSWLSDGFAISDLILVQGAGFNDGTYLVAGVTANTLTLTATNQLVGETVSNVQVHQVSYVLNPTQLTGNPSLTFARHGSGDTIVRASGQWGANGDGFQAGDVIVIQGSASANNNHTYTVAAITTTNAPNDTLVLTVVNQVTPETVSNVGVFTVFTAPADLAKIHNRGDPVYQLIDQNGNRVTVGTPYTPPTFNLNSLSAGTVLNLATLAGFNYQLQTTDLVSVTIMDPPAINTANLNAAANHGFKIFDLPLSEFTVDFVNNEITLNPSAADQTADPVIVKISIQSRAFHSNGDPKQYFGNEPLQAGQPVVQNDNLVLSSATLTGNPTLTFRSGGNGGTITRNAGSWSADGYKVGDTIQVRGTQHNDGNYTITAINTSGTILTVAELHLLDEGPVTSAQLRDTTHTSASVPSAASVTLAFSNSAGSTVTLSTGTWSAAGYQVGDTIQITGTQHNNGTYKISQISGATLTLSIVHLTNEGPDTSVQVLDTTVVLYTASTIVNAVGTHLYHQRGDPVFVQDSSGQWVQATYASTDPKFYLGNEPVLYVGGEPAYFTAADPIQVNQVVNAVTLSAQPATPATPSPGNKIQQVTLLGSPTGGNFTLKFGDQTATLPYNATAAAVLFALQNLSSIGLGNVSVTGVTGGPWTVTFGGTLGDVVPLLTADGSGLTGGASPSVRVTAATSGAIYFNAVGTINIKTGSGNDTFTVVGSFNGTTNLTTGAGNDTVAIQAVAGPTTVNTGAGDDTIGVGSEAGVWELTQNSAGKLVPTPGQPQFLDVNGTTHGIAGPLTINAGAPGPNSADVLTVDDTGTSVAETGALTSNSITGLGMSSQGITYSNLTQLNINLGSGGNTFTVITTAAGCVTNLDSGTGNDVINVDGPVGAFDNLNMYLTDATSRAATMTGLAGLLNMKHGETVNVFGMATINDFRIVDVTGVGFGSPAHPDAGIVYTPFSVASGRVIVNDGLIPDAHGQPIVNLTSGLPNIFFFNINDHFAINGDGNNTGHRDTLTVLGQSTTGLGSGAPYFEPEAVNGSDTFTVSDTQVLMINASLGPMRYVSLDQNTVNGQPQVTFSMLLIRGGNEATVPNDPFTGTGDTFIVTPSARLNLMIDGNSPVLPADQGDYLKVLLTGNRTLARVTDTTLWPTTHIRIGQTSDGGTVGYTNIETTNVRFTVTGGDVSSQVNVYDSDNLMLRYILNPYPASFHGGARVAVADVNGDGIPDIIVAPGPGIGPIIHVYDGVTGQLFPGVLGTFYAYTSNFGGGVYVAAADVNGDGYADIITGPDAGPQSPIVNVFSGNPAQATSLSPGLLLSFPATSSGFRGGVRVAAGNVTGDGRPEIITGLGLGAQPQVRVFQGNTGQPVPGPLGTGILAFETGTSGGILVAVGNVLGNGSHYQIIVGGVNNNSPRVRVFDGTSGQILSDFPVLTPSFGGGVRVGAVDYADVGTFDILVSGGPGSDPNAYLYTAAGQLVPGPFGKFPVSASNQGVFIAGGWRAGGFGLIKLSTVTPSNVNLSLAATTINERDTAVLNGSFSDPGSHLVYNVFINWGDGTSSTQILGPDVLTFTASHVYLDNLPNDAPYTISVMVKNVYGLSAAGSTQITVKNIPLASQPPTLQSPTGFVGTILPSFTFTAVAGADFYDFYLADQSTGQSPALRITSLVTNSLTLTTPLRPGDHYEWWVRATSSSGAVTPWSDPLLFIVAPAPISPSGTITTDTPTFTWATLTSATQYDVWVDDLTTGASQVLRNMNASGSSFTPLAAQALTPGDSYRWYIGAFTTGGEVWSNPQYFTIAPLATPSPTAPTGTLTTDQPVFTWTAVTGADHYDLWVDDLTTHQNQVLRNMNVAATNLSVSPLAVLTPGDSYRWYVGAVSTNGRATFWSGAQFFTITPLATPTPGNPTGTITTDQPTFTWTTVTGAAHYDLWVDDLTKNQSQVVRNMNATGTSFTLPAAQALSPGDSYRWYIGAVSTNGKATFWSGARFFNIAPLPAPTPSAPTGTLSTDQPTFTWTAVTGAAHYDLWVDDLTTARSQVFRNANASGLSYTLTAAQALSPGDSYRWFIGAVSTNGTTFWSGAQFFSIAALAAPTLVSPTGSTSMTTPTFTWNSVTMGAGYEVWVDVVTTTPTVVLLSPKVPTTSWSATSALTSGQHYRWWARALSANGTASAWSNSLDFSVL
jgi:hypothetical protein